jgi:hypothetical protein
MNHSGTVFIVHHVDTEGPLWENIEETFTRLRNIFGLDLPATYENLHKLQKGEIDLPFNHKKEIAIAVDPHILGYKRNWGMIEEMLARVLSSSFRDRVIDSFGDGWIYNWHVMDHVGFGSDNPRHRDMGHHNIFDFYTYILKYTNSTRDRIHWHFHPVSFYKQANVMATSYDNSISVLHQILCRRLIDKNWFPVVNRAGFHAERPDSNLFLEQWIPFDPSNLAVDESNQPKYQKDQINGRFADWNGAPSDWSVYHPSLYDWRLKGNANRVIARILNLKTRHRNINVEEIEKAFIKAASGENVYLGLANHDWREMSVEIDEFRDMLKMVAQKYPEVRFKFSETVDAFRQVLGYSPYEVEKNSIDLEVKFQGNNLRVDTINGEIFGPQPYLAFKTKNGEYFHDNFDFLTSKKSFSYVFDEYTIPFENIESVAVATNDKYGNTSIKRIDPGKEKSMKEESSLIAGAV